MNTFSLPLSASQIAVYIDAVFKEARKPNTFANQAQKLIEEITSGASMLEVFSYIEESPNGLFEKALKMTAHRLWNERAL